MTRAQLARYQRLTRKLPLGCKILDSGSPRGEKRYWNLYNRKGEMIAECSDLGTLERRIDNLTADLDRLAQS